MHGIQYEQDTVLIQYKEPAYRAMKKYGQLERKFQKHGLEDQPRGHKGGEFRKMRVTHGNLDAEIERLRRDKDVAYVNRNMIFEVHSLFTGNPLLPYDRSKSNDRYGGYIGWAHDVVPQVDPDLEVAVCDQGIITNHEDLTVHRTLRNTTWTSPDPSGAHGTIVAGCIAAMDNGTGSYGVAPGVKIVDALLADSFGSITAAAIADSWYGLLDEAYQPQYPNLKICNNSWGAGGYYFNLGGIISEYTSTIIVLQRLLNAGISVVFSAGNDARFFTEPGVTFPACLDTRTITVAASASPPWGFNPAPFSTYGGPIPGHTYPAEVVNPVVDLNAPGMWTLSTLPWSELSPQFIYSRKYDNPLAYSDLADKYGLADGTSFSAPDTSGTLALVHTVNPNLTVEQRKQLLVDSSDTVRVPGIGGRLNKLRAVLYAEQTLPDPPAHSFYAMGWSAPAPLRGVFDLHPNGYSQIEIGQPYYSVGGSIFIRLVGGGTTTVFEADDSITFTWLQSSAGFGATYKVLGTYCEYLPAGTLSFICTDVEQTGYMLTRVAQYHLDGSVTYTDVVIGNNSISIGSDICAWHICVTVAEDPNNENEDANWWLNIKDISFSATNQTSTTVVCCDVMTTATVNSVALVLDGVDYSVQTAEPYDFVVPDATLAAATSKVFRVDSSLGVRYVGYDSEYTNAVYETATLAPAAGLGESSPIVASSTSYVSAAIGEASGTAAAYPLTATHSRYMTATLAPAGGIGSASPVAAQTGVPATLAAAQGVGSCNPVSASFTRYVAAEVASANAEGRASPITATVSTGLALFMTLKGANGVEYPMYIAGGHSAGFRFN